MSQSQGRRQRTSQSQGRRQQIKDMSLRLSEYKGKTYRCIEDLESELEDRFSRSFCIIKRNDKFRFYTESDWVLELEFIPRPLTSLVEVGSIYKTHINLLAKDTIKNNR